MRGFSRRGILSACGTSLAIGAGCLGDPSASSGDDPDATDDGVVDWESFRANPSNTGFVDSNGPREEPTARWTIDLPSEPGTAAISDGAAYLAAGSTLRAIEFESGGERWTVDLPVERTGSPAAVDDGVVCPVGRGLFVVDREGDDGRLIPFDGGNASANASATAHRQPQSSGTPVSSPTVVDGTAYVGTPTGELVAVALADGEVTWRSDATVGWASLSQAEGTGGAVSSPTVVDGSVIVGTDAGVAAFDAADGSSEWTRGTERPVRSSPAVGDGAVYVGGADPVALSADGGDLLWRAGDAFATMGDRRSAVGRPQERAPMVPSVAVAEDVIVVHDPDDRLVALAKSDGTTRWETGLERVESTAVGAAESSVRFGPTAIQYAPSWSSPAIAGDVVVVGTSTGVVAVSLTNGDGLWRFPTESRVVASPAAADGTIVIGDEDGTAYALASA